MRENDSKRRDKNRTGFRKNDARKEDAREKHARKKDVRKNDVRKNDARKKELVYACPYFERCGGCSKLDLAYEKQLDQKMAYAKELFGSFGKVDRILGMKDPLHYRNKVHGVVMTDRKGNGFTGIYEEGSHHVIKVESCLIEDQRADAIMQSVASLMKSFKIRAYNEDRGYGFLRHILVRTAHATGQVMVVLVTTSPVFPSKNNFVKALRKLHPEITTIVVNINDKDTNMVLGERDIPLYGKGYIEDELCGKRFRLSPRSFYQVNSLQTEVLYRKAMDFAELTGKETVIDAYSGIGTIGIIASEHAGQVIGVELNKDAVKDAITNAKMNHVKNVRFYHGDAGRFMVGMAEEGQKADVVFLDPPRSGSDKNFLNSILKLKPGRVVYISCGPESLARDLKYLTSNGYKVVRLQPVDMFPMTAHMENVVLLERAHR